VGTFLVHQTDLVLNFSLPGKRGRAGERGGRGPCGILLICRGRFVLGSNDNPC